MMISDFRLVSSDYAALHSFAGLDYIDLVLIHWPGVARKPPDSSLHSKMRLETWRCLEQVHMQGKVRSIGVRYASQ